MVQCAAMKVGCGLPRKGGMAMIEASRPRNDALGVDPRSIFLSDIRRGRAEKVFIIRFLIRRPARPLADTAAAWRTKWAGNKRCAAGASKRTMCQSSSSLFQALVITGYQFKPHFALSAGRHPPPPQIRRLHGVGRGIAAPTASHGGHAPATQKRSTGPPDVTKARIGQPCCTKMTAAMAPGSSRSAPRGTCPAHPPVPDQARRDSPPRWGKPNRRPAGRDHTQKTAGPAEDLLGRPAIPMVPNVKLFHRLSLLFGPARAAWRCRWPFKRPPPFISQLIHKLLPAAGSRPEKARHEVVVVVRTRSA